MRLLALLVLAACGQATPPPSCSRLNDVACIDGEYFQCVCARQTCNPGDRTPGEWRRLGDGCIL